VDVFYLAVRRMFLCFVLGLAVSTAEADVPKLLPLRFVVINRTESDLTCQALAGRWYSFELGSEGPGERLTFDMSLDTATDTVSMFNKARVAVPIETLYCGYRGRAWETHFEFPLHYIANEAARQGGLTLTCRSAGSALICG